MARILFLSNWTEPFPFHVTQLGAVVGAEFRKLGPNLEIDYNNYDALIIVTRMVNSPSDLDDALRVVKAAKECNSKIKIITLEIEGVDYYELYHLSGSLSPLVLPKLTELLKLSNLIITGSEHHKQILFGLITYSTSIEVFGFIPENSEVYEKARTDAGHLFDNKKTAIGIGSKVGPARRGCLDIMVASRMSGYWSPKPVVVVPLTAGNKINHYDLLAEALGVEIFYPPRLSYEMYLEMLASLDIVVNIDSLYGASRLAFECAWVGTPCVGMSTSLYQNKYFPELSVNKPSVKKVHSLVYDELSRKFEEYGEPYSTKKYYDRVACDGRGPHIRKWKSMLENLRIKP